VWRVRENGATSGVGVIATYGYDVRGRRASLTRGNGTAAGYQYDPASSLLSQITEDMAGSAHDFTLTFAYNPAGQIVSSTRSNDLYSFTGQSTATIDTPPNGLNQAVAQNGQGLTYDASGNLASDGARSYLYAADNRLAQSNGNWLGADPLGRFNHSWYNNDGFDYDGHNLIVHRSGSTGPAYERFVHGPGADEPLMAVAADGSNRRFLHADERGSIVAMSDSSGNVVAVNRYDEYGVPASGNSGLFQYAGQPWLAGYGAEVYYSRARMYDPRLGRFLQTDPIGYDDGMNLYAYVGGDPVNGRDPSGTLCVRENWAMHVYDGNGNDLGRDTVHPEAWVEINCDGSGWGGDLTSTIDLEGGGGGAFSELIGFPLLALQICPVTHFTVTGVGPRQANTAQRTAISQEPGNRINSRAGGVAINPRNFGVPDVRNDRRSVFSQIRIYPLWDEAVVPETAPGNYPPRPPGLPSPGPYIPIDVIPTNQRHPGNQLDLYRYADQGQAMASTRSVPALTIIPRNDHGVRCPN
jgi:RHS repeat-associated protein